MGAGRKMTLQLRWKREEEAKLQLGGVVASVLVVEGEGEGGHEA